MGGLVENYMAKNKLSVRGVIALEAGKHCDGAGL